MRTSFAVFAVLSAAPALVLARPTYGSGPSTTTPIDDDKSHGSAVLYKSQKLKGFSSPTDYVPLPTDGACFDLTSLYGGWEDAARSLVVQKGFKCEFYTAFTCGGTPLCLNAKEGKVVQKTLPEAFDSRIKSVQCKKM